MITCFLLLLSLVVIRSFEIRGKLKIPKIECTSGMEVVLKKIGDEVSDSTYISSDCQFMFPLVSSGKYSVLILNSNFEFPFLTLSVTDDAHVLHIRYPMDFTIKKMVGKKKGEVKEKGYVIPAVKKRQFFVPVQPSQIAGYLKSPMVLFMAFGLFMVVVTPLISNTEEMKETQEMLGGGLKKFQGYLDKTYDGLKVGKLWDGVQKKGGKE